MDVRGILVYTNTCNVYVNFYLLGMAFEIRQSRKKFSEVFPALAQIMWGRRTAIRPGVIKIGFRVLFRGQFRWKNGFISSRKFFKAA